MNARPLEQALCELDAALGALVSRHAPPGELAFYGATFTALDMAWQERFLKLAAKYRAAGLVTRVRCSTRPDAMNPAQLAQLKNLGLDMVEVGVQSFDDAALTASGRGHAGEVALQACGMVREAGLALGIQLMPGMPGQGLGVFERDVALAAELRPETVRLYPCLVIAGSRLARMWQDQTYTPLDLEQAVDHLARALPVLWSAGARVIRMGLAGEPGLVGKILAGPWHPALGLMARSRALYDLVAQQARELSGTIEVLKVPQRLQGEFWGHEARLRPRYERLGISQDTVRFQERDDLEFVLRKQATA